VLVTTTSPHRLTPQKLAAARATPPLVIAGLNTPRIAVLVGGDSRHHRFTPADIERFAGQLDELARSGVSLMGSPSRRTSPALAAAVAAVFTRHGGWWWDGTGENPFLALLANADAVVVTADSTNMIGEAAAAGRPVLVFEPTGGHPKIAALVAALEREGVVHRFCGRLEGEAYEPIDSTPIIADAIRQGWLRHRASLGFTRS
jgi:mitochondrial fission protein ELM1